MSNSVLILVVENDPATLEKILGALRDERFFPRVHVARDGGEALDFLFCTGPFQGSSPVDQPALIVLDLEVPRVHGLELLKVIRAYHRTHTIPVVVFTRTRDPESIVRAYDLGANSVVVQPEDAGGFRDTTRRLVRYWLDANHSDVAARHDDVLAPRPLPAKPPVSGS